MNNWLKNKIQQLSDKLNADETEPVRQQGTAPEKGAFPATGRPAGARWDNIEELKEVIWGAISQSMKMLGYGKSVVAGLVFHSRFADHAVENQALDGLIRDNEFLNQIKRNLKSKGIPYQESFSVALVPESDLVDKVTEIVAGIGVEVVTPGMSLRPIKGRLVATEGLTWEPEYIIEPNGKNYFIGRCKDPKIEGGPKIHNDIAFVGIEEKDEDQYAINNYISRSHATIIFDKDLGAFKIYRSKFLNNPSHKIKIFNTSRQDYAGVSLNQSSVPHVLKDGDAICFNDKIVLEFSIIHSGTGHSQ